MDFQLKQQLSEKRALSALAPGSRPTYILNTIWIEKTNLACKTVAHEDRRTRTNI